MRRIIFIFVFIAINLNAIPFRSHIFDSDGKGVLVKTPIGYPTGDNSNCDSALLSFCEVNFNKMREFYVKFNSYSAEYYGGSAEYASCAFGVFFFVESNVEYKFTGAILSDAPCPDGTVRHIDENGVKECKVFNPNVSEMCDSLAYLKCPLNSVRDSSFGCECKTTIPDGCNSSFPLDTPTSGQNCQSSYITAEDGISGKTCYNCSADNNDSNGNNEPSLDDCDNLNTTYTNYCQQNGGTLKSFTCNQIEGQSANFEFNCEYSDTPTDNNDTPPLNDYNETTTVFNPDTNETTTKTTIQTDENGTITRTTTDSETGRITTVIIGGNNGSSGGGQGGSTPSKDYTNLLNSINKGIKNNTDTLNKDLTGTMPTDSTDTSAIDSFIDGVETIDGSNYQSKLEGQFNSIYDSYSSKVLSKFTGWLDASNLDTVNPFVLLNNYYLSHQFQTLSIDLSATNVDLLSNAPSMDFTKDLVIDKFQKLYDITNVIFVFLGVLQGFLIFTRVIAND